MKTKQQISDALRGENLTVGTKNLSNREAWLAKTLKKIPANSKILDAGAGELQYKRFCKHLKYTSQDFAQYNGEGDGKGLQTDTWDNTKLDIVSDIADIPVKAKQFDAIMCIEVFEHIPHPTEAIKEFSRIIKPGGTLLITTPVSSLTHFAPYYFYNGYSRYYFEKVLADYGFEDIKIQFNGNYFEVLAQELRRVEGLRETYAKNAPRQSWREKLASGVLLKRLEVLSKTDKGSKELTSHGLHVTAKRSKK